MSTLENKPKKYYGIHSFYDLSKSVAPKYEIKEIVKLTMSADACTQAFENLGKALSPKTQNKKKTLRLTNRIKFKI